jgi:acid phosphatase type 7
LFGCGGGRNCVRDHSYRAIGNDASGKRRRVSWRALILVAFALAIIVMPNSAAGTTAFFSDGFESGNLSAWTNSSVMTVQQQVVFEGAYAARATTTGSTAAYAYKNLSPTVSNLFYDGRFYVVSQGNSNSSLVRFRTATVGPILSMFRRSDSKLTVFNEVTGVSTNGPTVSAGTWHELQVHVLINGASSVVEVWLDGILSSVLSGTTSLGTTPVGRVYIGDTGSGRSFDFAFDNQVLSTGSGSDISPPTIPTGLTATVVNPNHVHLTWQASTDDVGVTGYTVYRNGSQLAVVDGATTSYSDTDVVPGTQYSYAVDAFDAASNRSPRSSPAVVTTPSAPANVGLPTISGTTRVGDLLTANAGTWSGTQLIAYQYQWQDCDQAGGACVDIAAATSQTYVLTSGDLGHTVRVAVTASNDWGSAAASSNATAVVVDSGAIFSDGFESGTLLGWTSSSGMTAQQQVVFEGAWAARATATGSTGAYAYKTLSPTMSDLFYEGRFYVVSQGNSNSALVRFRTAAVGPILTILRTKGNNKLTFFNEVTGVSKAGPTVSAGIWHDLEVHVVVNGASSLVEVWLDGTLSSALSGSTSLGTTPVGRVYIGDNSGRNFVFAFDNQVLSAAGDFNPPTTPTGLAAVPIGSGRLNVTWNPSQDDLQVAGYTLYRDGNAVATLGPITTGYADAGLPVSTTFSYEVDAFDAAGNRSARSTAVAATTGEPTSDDPVIAAAGDISCDPLDSRFNGGQGTPTACRQASTSNILFNSVLTAVLPIGDEQYEDGTYSKFMQSYDASWGRLRTLSRPVPGNHEYLTPNATGYFTYFGAAGGDPTKGYYSYDIGDWHIIALNSACAFVGGCLAGSPQTVWLENDLAAHQNLCTLAYWHEPRFSSGVHGDDDSFGRWWLDLYNAGAEIVLNGHDHQYERLAPQDPDQNPVANGIREFIAGTGGEEHEPVGVPVPNSEITNTDTFGVLKLTLRSSGYDWQFVPESGGTFTDSGSGTCHARPVAPQQPSAGAVQEPDHNHG